MRVTQNSHNGHTKFEFSMTIVVILYDIIHTLEFAVQFLSMQEKLAVSIRPAAEYMLVFVLFVRDALPIDGRVSRFLTFLWLCIFFGLDQTDRTGLKV